jgi:AcrR family transcriptional regulator
LIHRGKILEKVLRTWCQQHGAALTYVAKRAGYDRTSVYRHFREEELSFGIIRQYGKAIRHDFTAEFPPMKDEEEIGLDPDDPYTSMSRDECFKQVTFWRNKYIGLLEQYNTIVVDKLLLNK